VIKTQQGFQWLDTGIGYKDLNTGIIWNKKPEVGFYEFGMAFDKVIPTKLEYQTAINHGLLELIKFKPTWYWTSSRSLIKNGVWFFHGENNNFGVNGEGNGYLVLCITHDNK